MEKKENITSIFQRLAYRDDQDAFYRLHADFFPRLFRLVYSLTGQREVAEELTNDVFIQIWQNRRKLNSIKNPEVYLFVCAKNIAFAYLKSIKLPIVSLDGLQQFDLQIERTAEDILISSEMVSRINTAIAQLPAQCKLVFLLVKENNLKYREVAAVLDISVKTVEAQMNIALKKLTSSIPFLLPAFSR
ncbi:hypothetical protein A3860_23550 [Niastella vici]|uniref:RNA polymerase sigma-70 factor n=1 Tax=Niastella vici TaxID=1703345 RepID=A0A1V9G059_9BACT|nr:sigma-70 family RNA polymerase sigma factor [Niastella vici]OQP63908.1 hypothetical protein A3860_23550 [Niastella vici]